MMSCKHNDLFSAATLESYGMVRLLKGIRLQLVFVIQQNLHKDDEYFKFIYNSMR